MVRPKLQPGEFRYKWSKSGKVMGYEYCDPKSQEVSSSAVRDLAFYPVDVIKEVESIVAMSDSTAFRQGTGVQKEVLRDRIYRLIDRVTQGNSGKSRT